MNIESVSFGNSDAELINTEIGKHLGTFKEVTTPSEDADLLIVWIDGVNSIPFLEQTILPENPFKIFIVHTLIGAVVPFLKSADYLLYMGAGQKDIVEAVLDVSYRGETVRFPGAELTKEDGVNDAFVYAPNEFSDELVPYLNEVAGLASSWFGVESVLGYSSETVRLICNVPEDKTEQFDAWRSEQSDAVIIKAKQECSREEIRDYIANSSCGDCFIQEISNDQLKEFVETSNTAMVYMTYSTDWIIEEMARGELKVQNDYDGLSRSALMDNHDVVSYEWFADKIKSILAEIKPVVQEELANRNHTTEVDTLDSLDIIAGKPLANDYIFSICFRNQEEKIVRALDSILSQKGGIDYGIAIVDDDSVDKSSENILNRLEGFGVDFVLVKNKKRRFASRNFFNIINFLTTSEDSVLIELDGDDFLADDRVLLEIDKAYKEGALKTAGSFTVFPDVHTPAAQEIFSKHGCMDFSRPWSLGACNTWLPLRSAKLSILKNIELDYFLERHSKQWLADRHDAITQSRAIELAGADKCTFIDKPLYVYDLSGADHDHGDHEEYDRNDHNMKLFRDLERYYRPYNIW